jgi:hypothetical protein
VNSKLAVAAASIAALVTSCVSADPDMGSLAPNQVNLTERALPEPSKLTHIRVTLPRTLFHERPASFVRGWLWGSRWKAADIAAENSIMFFMLNPSLTYDL